MAMLNYQRVNEMFNQQHSMDFCGSHLTILQNLHPPPPKHESRVPKIKRAPFL